MRFSIPETVPSRREIIANMLLACVPDGKEFKPYGFARACDSISRQYGYDIDSFNEVTSKKSALCALIHTLASYAHNLTGKSMSYYVDRILGSEKVYRGFLATFCEDYSGSLKNWLAADGGIDKSFEAAVFFTYTMLVQKQYHVQLQQYLINALGLVGISDINDVVWQRMTEFDLNERQQDWGTIVSDACAISNSAVITLAVINFTLLEIVGEKNSEKRNSAISHAQDFVSEIYKNEITAHTAMTQATLTWLQDVQLFEPRSIDIGRTNLKPQDFYVHPTFHSVGIGMPDPLQRINQAEKSQRIILRAKTGMGKTMYLRMISLCMLKSKLKDGSANASLLELSQKLHAPSDKYVMFIPASMFSFCYLDPRYTDWTLDLVDLFFNSMFKLAPAFNFYSGGNPQRYSISPDSRKNMDYAVTPALKDYVRDLAKRGKLVLIMDSFDEIVSGDMRMAYIKSLSRFCGTYCQYPEKDDVGAHIIVSSREMSVDTMSALARSLLVDYPANVYEIDTLSPEQSRELITNWGRYFGDTPTDIENNISSFAENHFCAEFSSNPYMLSVMCAKRGFDYNRITQVFINTLVDKMRSNYRADNEIVIDILQSQNITTILQNVALKTIENANPHFSTHELGRQIRQFISDDELSADQINSALQQLYELFVTAVGLIVPADGEDSAYQFINDQIRFFLAARGIRRELGEFEGRSTIYQNILKAQGCVGDYVGLLVPLLSDLGNNSDAALAEMLVLDLVLRDHNDTEEPIIVQTIIDLILGRFGANIATPSIIGNSDNGRATKRTQRLLILRLFSSNKFEPTKTEKLRIRRSPAFCYNVNILRKEQIELLG